MISTLWRGRPSTAAADWQLCACARSRRGEHRTSNEDYVLVEPAAGIFVLADGMGGHEGGAEASELVCAVMAGEIMETRVTTGFGVEAAGKAFQRAASVAMSGMRELACACPQLHHMGSTVVVAWFVGEDLYYGSAGDSRLYRLRGANFTQLTRDDTLAESLQQAGVATHPPQTHNRWRHYLTRYIGPASTDAQLQVDRLTVQPGDRFLMVSDGISDVLDERTLARAAGLAETPQELCRWLDLAARTAGATDDRSSLVIDCVPREQPLPR